MARSNVAEVVESGSERSGATVRERLADLDSIFVKVIAGIPVPVRAKYHEGHRCSAKEARALNWAHNSRAGSVANSNVTRGKQKDLSDEAKSAWLTNYLNAEPAAGGYSFSDELGGEFDESLLDMAARRVVEGIFDAQGKDKTNAEAVNAVLVKITTDAGLADKYTPMVESAAQAILAERHEARTRKTKSEVNVDDIAL